MCFLYFNCIFFPITIYPLAQFLLPLLLIHHQSTYCPSITWIVVKDQLSGFPYGYTLPIQLLCKIFEVKELHICSLLCVCTGLSLGTWRLKSQEGIVSSPKTQITVTQYENVSQETILCFLSSFYVKYTHGRYFLKAFVKSKANLK